MDHKKLKSLRISIRRTRAKLRKQISTTFHIPDIVDIIIDCICWNRRMIDTIRDNKLYMHAYAKHHKFRLYIDIQDGSDHLSSVRHMNPGSGLWALLRKFNEEQYAWGYWMLCNHILELQARDDAQF